MRSRSIRVKTNTLKIEQNMKPGFLLFWLSESTVFKSVQKAIYGVRNKPVREFKN